MIRRQHKPRSFQAHHLCLVLLLVSLVFNLLLFGGLLRQPEGKAFRDSARREAPLALVYMSVGEQLLRIPGFAGVGESLAIDAFSPLSERVRANPSAAMDLVQNADAGTALELARFNYWATPVLLLLWIVLFLLRPRDVHLVRR